MRGNRKRVRGFTLTELMVVLSVIGIVAVATAPTVIRAWKRPALEREANDLASTMRLCRQKAVWRRIPYRLTIDPARRCYWTERQDTTGTWVLDPVDSVRVDGTVQFSVRAGGSGSNNDILFLGRGSVDRNDAPATVEFWDAREETLSVQLIRTGRVRMSRRG
ncbi:MAG: GspH/FimT family pseudopilin [Candidatus Eisenbacteria bacterium]|nr:GspH/FimT family pseudopilin [Candidatus Eisenbacteria bacterium]